MSHIKERQQELQPGRTEYAITRLRSLGYPVIEINATTLQFTFRGFPVTLYPYSGWFTGKTVKDGRGIKNLLKQIPMRFALRRQEKIKAAFEPNGDEILTRIKESLTRYFSADRSDYPEGLRTIEDDFNQLPGEPYPTIAINDVGNNNRMIEFFVTGKQYDVYHVAFKGFTKG
jgi:hypothetical protein|nr:MAG TPA: hypothetical protein [Caudoviricetes sp.]